MDIVKYMDVPNFPDYQIGDDGNARKRIGNDIFRGLSPIKNSNGYTVFTMVSPEGSHCQTLANRIVLFAFVGNPPKGKPEACHRNGLRFDNRLDNLYWGSYTENEHDKIATGTKAFGERCNHRKLTESKVREIRQLISNKIPLVDIAIKYGVTATSIQWVKVGRTWGWVKD